MNGKSSGNELWSAAERTKWIVAMMCGTVLLFATRSAVPISAVAMGQDLSWDKEISVSWAYETLLNEAKQG